MLSKSLDRPLLFLLTVLLLFFVVTPFLGFVFLTDVVMSAVLCFGVYAVSGANRKILAICIGLVSLAFVGIWAGHLSDSRWFQILDNTCEISFFVIVLIQILRRIFRSHRVEAETIAGAICIYLLIGVVWSDLYAIVEVLRPGSFFGGGPSDGFGEIYSGRGLEHKFAYFSFVTLSTLGFGEIVPVTPGARMLSALEAVTGQLYLAVIMARLITMYKDDDVRVPRGESPSEGDPPR